ncbi:MAG: hypothetical protein PWP51_1587 [Clostridiales bacterium]|jgi:NAD-dependent dihydropyrimidine dehydrogenase PreA subunit|nr:hypothetical protein [Clostridiales bacterium]MDN5299034.1 hypothetical protein [Clostridiales bacterium]
MSKKWYPTINYETCIECGACVGKCTHGVYAKETQTPKVIFPEGCIDGCHGCQNLCPTQSIQYVGDTGQSAGCSCNCNC